MSEEVNKTAAIVADNYKLKTFRKNLKDAGFKWEELKFTDKTTVLKVKYKEKDYDVLQSVVKTSNGQSTRRRKK